jgi:hypothetical protein
MMNQCWDRDIIQYQQNYSEALGKIMGNQEFKTAA